MGSGLAALLLLPACRSTRVAPDAAPVLEAEAPATAGQPPVRAVDASVVDAQRVEDASLAAMAPPLIAFDAGVNGCKLVYGPIQQPMTGEVVLAEAPDAIEVIANKGGVPAVARLPLPPLGGPKTGKVVLETAPPRSLLPACAVAAHFVYCADDKGAVVRAPRTPGSPEGQAVPGLGKVVAHARPGTRPAAAPLPDGHTVVVYVVEKKNDESVAAEAFAVLDDGPGVRISDEGSGATSVAVAARGDGAVALMVDARTAMTPVHARTLADSGGKLVVGPDAVVFVGGGAEPHTAGVLASALAQGGPASPRDGSAGGPGFLALLPVAGELGFGMAAVRLSDPPGMDEKTVWSMYPNGLDPAPIAATAGRPPIRVARVRPVDARPDAARGVELGRIDDAGQFVPYGMISTLGRPTWLSVANDAAGALWVGYTDGAGTWLERRTCW